MILNIYCLMASLPMHFRANDENFHAHRRFLHLSVFQFYLEFKYENYKFIFMVNSAVTRSSPSIRPL